MKKTVGIIGSLMVLIALITGILFFTGVIGKKADTPVDDTVFEQYYDGYVNRIADNNDVDIYNSLLDESLRKRFTIEQISQMNDYLRGFGKIKKTENIKIKKTTNNNKSVYEVSSKVIYENAPQIVRIKIVKKGNDYKITAFSFTNEL